MSGWEQNYGFEAQQNSGFYDPNAAGYNYNNYDASGIQFDSYSNQQQQGYSSNTFDSQGQSGGFGGNFDASQTLDDEFANEPPLLEELGINPEHIMQKTLTVLNPFRTTRTDVAGDADLAGPLVFCLAFGSLLLLSGKIHFNYIYGIGAMGCVANYGEHFKILF